VGIEKILHGLLDVTHLGRCLPLQGLIYMMICMPSLWGTQ
jgi:hypothetical protein